MLEMFFCCGMTGKAVIFSLTSHCRGAASHSSSLGQVTMVVVMVVVVTVVAGVVVVVVVVLVVVVVALGERSLTNDIVTGDSALQWKQGTIHSYHRLRQALAGATGSIFSIATTVLQVVALMPR
jgi:hypothetical protein